MYSQSYLSHTHKFVSNKTKKIIINKKYMYTTKLQKISYVKYNTDILKSKKNDLVNFIYSNNNKIYKNNKNVYYELLKDRHDSIYLNINSTTNFSMLKYLTHLTKIDLYDCHLSFFSKKYIKINKFNRFTMSKKQINKITKTHS
jgi:hypothetical protein